MSGSWLSKRAVLWAIDDAPGVPPQLVSTLIAVARHAGEDGRGSHPSALTVARHTRKNRRQARRDLDELEKLGLLVKGDQALAEHIRADRRPTVYDLPMPRGDIQDPPSSSRGVTQGRTGGHTGSHEGSHRTPEEILNNSGITREPSQPLSADGLRSAAGQTGAQWGDDRRTGICRSPGHKQWECPYPPVTGGWCTCPCHKRRAAARAQQGAGAAR